MLDKAWNGKFGEFAADIGVGGGWWEHEGPSVYVGQVCGAHGKKFSKVFRIEGCQFFNKGLLCVRWRSQFILTIGVGKYGKGNKAAAILVRQF